MTVLAHTHTRTQDSISGQGGWGGADSVRLGLPASSSVDSALAGGTAQPAEATLRLDMNSCVLSLPTPVA